MPVEKQIIAALLLPLFSAVISYFAFNSHKKLHVLSGWVASASVFGSFILFLILFYTLRLGLAQEVNAILNSDLGSWINVGLVQIDFMLRIDGLSAVMSLLVTGVGFLIHVYANGYMAKDENRPRFFAYLNLFIFAMLILVLADNLLLLFVGWEGVGLCSYLLIGFWHKDMNNAQAGQKAFVVNRIGDAGFIVGMITLFLATGTLSFSQLQSLAVSLSPELVALAALCLFIGAIGKSAQLPLFVWLPDAMAGPTPVSALIHAATMVTAGIYLICRLSFLYTLAPSVLALIAIIGALTAFFAATIALVQNDIKKVLAYSTISQLGFMFMALGAGAYSNAIYHVITHAFFKACLFMCAGSVINACHHEQDMRHYGGLWKKMPCTFACYLVAVLAIAGVPWTSGFYSKDALLWTVFSEGDILSFLHLGDYSLAVLIYYLGLFTALLTAIYMGRSLVMTFFGQYRGHGEVKESSAVMVVPIAILASLSYFFASRYGDILMELLYPWTRSDMQLSHHLLAENPVFKEREHLSMFVALGGLALALTFFWYLPKVTQAVAKVFAWPHKLLSHKYYIDEIYNWVIVEPLRFVAGALFKVIDRALIEGLVNGSGALVLVLSRRARVLQSSMLSSNVLTMSTALILFLFWLLW
ncbi:MAG: NADH-quinone oxidoreductase subunit L [Deltaproteobacteria bacterium]|nr:NADH-quinone oxidoreductase subunit L [Deltaproteobacteria bacterium]